MAPDDRDPRNLDDTAPAEAYCPSCDSSFSADLAVCPSDGTQLVSFPATTDDLVGRVIDGRFEIREQLGKGGMGTVYRALQRSVGREVAIKVIEPALARQRAAAKRFLREARLTSRLTHPSTVIVFDCGQADGMLYLVMELLAGETLGELIERTGPMPVERVVAIGTQLCDALIAAHALGIVHRDLKPSNVIVLAEPAERDTVKVLDFGLAKSLHGDDSTTTITESNAVMGTPRYMAPEAIRGEPADARTDLYSLGCMLYEMAAGEPPFVAPTTSALFAHHLMESPPAPPPAARALAPLLAELMAKEPEKRPGDAAEVRRRLGEAAAATSSAASVPADTVAATRARTPAARPRWLTPLLGGAAVAVAVAAIAVAAVALRGNTPDTPATDPAAADTRADPTAPSKTSALSPQEQTALSPPPPPSRGRAGVGGDVADAAPRAITLTLRASPPARVSIDGIEVGTTPITHPVTAGDQPVDVVFRRAGHITERRRVVPDDDRPVEVTLRPRRSAPPQPRPEQPRETKPPDVDFVVPRR
jgi:eukaryotic-like serine/threonine-protein kinase